MLHSSSYPYLILNFRLLKMHRPTELFMISPTMIFVLFSKALRLWTPAWTPASRFLRSRQTQRLNYFFGTCCWIWHFPKLRTSQLSPIRWLIGLSDSSSRGVGWGSGRRSRAVDIETITNEDKWVCFKWWHDASLCLEIIHLLPFPHFPKL